MSVLILWCRQQFDLRRIVINSRLPEAALICDEARRLSVPVVMDDDQTTPVPGDLWVGLCPQKGWGDVGDCAAPRAKEAQGVLNRLRDAQPS